MYIDTMLLFDLNVTGVHRIKKKHYEQTLYTFTPKFVSRNKKDCTVDQESEIEEDLSHIHIQIFQNTSDLRKMLKNSYITQQYFKIKQMT